MDILNLVPDTEFCILLKRLGFPQENSAFYWVDRMIRDKEGKPVMRLQERTVLDGLEVRPHSQDFIFAAPTAEEFQNVAPGRFFTMKAPGGYLLIDASGTQMKIEDAPEKSVGGRMTSIVFKKVENAEAKTASEAWAKGFIFLISTGGLKLSEGSNGKIKT